MLTKHFKAPFLFTDHREREEDILRMSHHRWDGILGLSHDRRWYFVRCANLVSHSKEVTVSSNWVITVKEKMASNASLYMKEHPRLDSSQKLALHQMRQSCKSFKRGYSLLQLSHQNKKGNMAFKNETHDENISSDWFIPIVIHQRRHSCESFQWGYIASSNWVIRIKEEIWHSRMRLMMRIFPQIDSLQWLFIRDVILVSHFK